MQWKQCRYRAAERGRLVGWKERRKVARKMGTLLKCDSVLKMKFAKIAQTGVRKQVSKTLAKAMAKSESKRGKGLEKQTSVVLSNGTMLEGLE